MRKWTDFMDRFAYWPDKPPPPYKPPVYTTPDDPWVILSKASRSANDMAGTPFIDWAWAVSAALVELRGQSGKLEPHVPYLDAD